MDSSELYRQQNRVLYHALFFFVFDGEGIRCVVGILSLPQVAYRLVEEVLGASLKKCSCAKQLGHMNRDHSIIFCPLGLVFVLIVTRKVGSKIPLAAQLPVPD